MSLFTYPKFQSPTLDGVNLAGGKVYFYEVGTSTPKDTYTDSGLGTENANPVILNARGEADIWLDGDYKIALHDADDVEVWTDSHYESAPAPSTYKTKAEAAVLTLTSKNAGKKIFITSADGGEFTVRYDVTAPYVDNGGAFCGTVFIPTGGDGTIGIERSEFTGTILPQWFGAYSDGTDISAQMQVVMDSPYDVAIPDGTYILVDVQLKRSKSLNWGQGAKFKVASAGTYVFKLYGGDAVLGQDEEGSIRVQSNRIEIDGDSRAYAVDGLHLERILRSEIGEILIERTKNKAIDFVNNVQETKIGVIRTTDCGSTTSTNVFNAVLDLSEATTTSGAHNNIFIDAIYLVYSRGPALYIDSANTRTTNPRKIHIDNYFIHGHIEASDPISDPLTTAEKDDCRQVILGTCDDIFFGKGLVGFGANNIQQIHLTSGSNGDVGLVTFDHVIMNNRYDFASTASDNIGIQQDTGKLIIKGIWIGNGYAGHNALRCETGAEMILSPFDQVIGTGSISIVDDVAIFSRKMNWDFGAKELNNIKQLKGRAAAFNITEGVSGSDRIAIEINSLANSARAEAKFGAGSLLTQDNVTLPTAANMILDSVPSAIAYDGTNLRWFNGTIWKTFTVT